MSRASPNKIGSRGAREPQNGVVLRPGAETHQLFLFPGGGGDCLELAPLASLLDAPWSVIGIEAWRPTDVSSEPPRTVYEMARTARDAIKAVQQHGPYRLAGYSLGGLVALETANALLRSGEEVQFLALIDCAIYQRFWSARQRLRGRLRRIARFFRTPARTNLAKTMGHARAFARRLVMQLRRESRQPLATAERCEAAFRIYRPRAYPGRAFVVGPDRSREVGVDFAALWEGFAGAVEVIRVPGGHLELVRSGEHLKDLARALSDALRSTATNGPDGA